MTESQRVSGSGHVLRNAAALLCALLFYYGVPIDWDRDVDLPGRILGFAAFLAGVGGLIWLTVRRIERYLRAPLMTGGRVDGILLLLCVVAMFFALFYYRLGVHYPGQFEGLSTRTDALYYTVVTLGTVGYGDVHAIGQAARIATMVQIIFDLIVIGSLLAIVSTGVARRLEVAAGRRPDDAQLSDDTKRGSGDDPRPLSGEGPRPDGHD
ncbi:potassium channel family protein [Nocardia xishanensis]|uniref:Potassium channel family protein n=1 Tax=Nocardia xishanensis TaxID=238964 RepID=A0ABW7WZ59_9NOCA